MAFTVFRNRSHGHSVIDHSDRHVTLPIDKDRNLLTYFCSVSNTLITRSLKICKIQQ